MLAPSWPIRPLERQGKLARRQNTPLVEVFLLELGEANRLSALTEWEANNIRKIVELETRFLQSTPIWQLTTHQAPDSTELLLYAIFNKGGSQMKQYKPRPGIVRTTICGVHVLIPTREVYDHCNTIQLLPLLWAYTWDGLVNGKTLEETLQFHRILTKRSDEEILQRLEKFYSALCEKGFLIERSDDPLPLAGIEGVSSQTVPPQGTDEVSPSSPADTPL